MNEKSGVETQGKHPESINRQSLEQFHRRYHCGIVGICLTIPKRQKLLRISGLTGVTKMRNFKVQTLSVHASSSRKHVSKLLQKSLDQKQEIKERFMQTEINMKKIIMTILLAFVALHTFATEELPTILETMTVSTATKTEKEIEGVSASVIVLDEAAIAQMGASSLGDVFAKIPGLTRQYGTFPSASSASKSSISLRGMGATGTLFLIDGERLAGEVKNPYDLDRIPASQIERIEIVKGPMSTLYGADAVGGVINIITKQPKKGFEGLLNLKAGSNSDGAGERQDLGLNIRGKKEKIKYSIYANILKSTPYTQSENAEVLVPTPNGMVAPSLHPHPGTNSMKDFYKTDVTYREEANVSNVSAKIGFNVSETFSANLALSYLDEERSGVYNGFFHPSGIFAQDGKPIPVFNVPVNSIDENSRRVISGDINWTTNESLFLKLKIYNTYYKKRNTTSMKHWQDFGFQSEVQSEANGMNANVDITSYELNGNYARFDSHLLTFGAEYRDEAREATVFDNTPNMGTREVRYKSVYMQDEWELSDDFNMILGARYDVISNAENKATFKLGSVKKITPLLNIRFNLAQGYRTPDIRELYINKQTPNGLQLGSDVVGYDLKPEFTNSVEVGARGRKAGFNYSVALFFNRIEDRIEQVPWTQPNSYTFVNVSKAETKGMETSLGYLFEQGSRVSFAWTELRTEDKETGKNLEFNPERTFSLDLAYRITNHFNVGVLAIYAGEQNYLKQTKNGRIDAITKDFTLVDLTSSYTFGRGEDYEIFMGINNLLDETVENILGSNMGTYFFGGWRMKF